MGSGGTSHVQDWPYASLSTGMVNATAVAPSRLRLPTPLSIETYDDMVAGLRFVVAGLGLQAAFGAVADAVAPLVAGYRGDFAGAVWSMCGGPLTRAPIAVALAAGEHLGARGPSAILESMNAQMLAEVLAVSAKLPARVSALDDALAEVVRRLTTRVALSARHKAELEAARPAVVAGIHAASVAIMAAIRGAAARGPSVPYAGAQPVDLATCRRVAEVLSGGLRYAASLRERGLEAPAQHVIDLLGTLAPEAVAPGGGSGTTVSPAHCAGPLHDLVVARDGDQAAMQRIAEAAAAGTFSLHGATEPSDDAKMSLRVWEHNDNQASLRDGVLRSDDGATMSAGASFDVRRPNGGFSVRAEFNMFTERGGSTRTDFAQLELERLWTQPTGALFFDTVTTGLLVGVQATGNLGGAAVQDFWHGATGSVLGGRRLGAGLQDEYLTPVQLAALLGAQVRGDARVGPLDFSVGVGVRAPLGPTGVGRVQSDFGVRYQPSTGLHAAADLGLAYQFAIGDALAFDGAPVTGVVLQPRLVIGWKFDTWGIGLEWQGNRYGTQPGFGDRDGESVALWVSFDW